MEEVRHCKRTRCRLKTTLAPASSLYPTRILRKLRRRRSLRQSAQGKVSVATPSQTQRRDHGFERSNPILHTSMQSSKIVTALCRTQCSQQTYSRSQKTGSPLAAARRRPLFPPALSPNGETTLLKRKRSWRQSAQGQLSVATRTLLI